MNYINEPLFIQIMADWMAKEFPSVIYEEKSAWWVFPVTDQDNFRHRELVAWIGYENAFCVGRNGMTSHSFNPCSPAFFEACKTAVFRRLQDFQDV